MFGGRKAILIVSLVVGWHTPGWSESSTDENSSAYFTIQDSRTQETQRTEAFETPDRWLEKGFAAVTRVATQLSLLNWVKHSGAPPLSPENYNRKKHFGSWIHDPNDNTCMNTRAQILARDSSVAVTMKPNNHCIVDTGQWEDPYSGVVRTSAREMQIDHVVPLKNAFISGAWSWKTEKRCLYANFMANHFHLIAVDGHENMAKGDSAPDQYLPPSKKYICTYLQEWLKIKMIWNLTMTQAEATSIRDNVNQYGCDTSLLQITSLDLRRQRLASDEIQTSCQKMANRIEAAEALTKENSATTSSQAVVTP